MKAQWTQRKGVSFFLRARRADHLFRAECEPVGTAFDQNRFTLKE